MSDQYTAYTREEFIAKFGYDPSSVATDAPAVSESSPLVNHLKSAAVGTAAIPTDLANLPSTIGTAIGAGINSYRNDTKFLDEFAKATQVDDAQKNLQGHIDAIATSWKQSNPALSDDDINQGIADYQKSKQFEDFATSQLRGTHWLAARTRQGLRSLVGDERPESARGWTESAAEILPSAGIGFGSGALVRGGTALATRLPASVGRAVMSPVGQGTLRVAEAVTPLTVPYTGTNIAVNAGVQLSIDQALRYAQGKSTAFTPEGDGDQGVGTLAAIGVGVAGVAAAVGAVRGRTQRALLAAQQAASTSPTVRALEQQPSLDLRTADPMRPGEASIIAGPERVGAEATPELDTRNVVSSVWRRAKNQLIDERDVGLNRVRAEHGAMDADLMEAIHSETTGAAFKDLMKTNTELQLRPTRLALDAMPPQMQRAAELGAQAWMYAARYRHQIAQADAGIQEIQGRLQRVLGTPEEAAVRTELATAQATRQAVVLDVDPALRKMLPDVSMSRFERLAREWETDPDPRMVNFRNAIERWGDQQINQQVIAGKMSAEIGAELRARYRYYTPAMQDPLGGTTGFARMHRSVMNSIRRAMTSRSKGTGGTVPGENPIRRLNHDPRAVGLPTDPETRITALHNMRSAMHMYTQNNLLDVAHTRNRNEWLRRFHTNPVTGGWSDAVNDGHMRIVPGPNGRDWIGPGHVDYINRQIRKDNIVAEWQGGRARLWDVGDAELAKMMRHEPVIANGLIRGVEKSSQIVKFWTTGHGNPFWAPTGAAYDAAVALMTTRAHRSFGLVSYGAHKYLPEWFARGVMGRVPDISVVPMLPYSALRGLIDVNVFYGFRRISEMMAQQNPAFAAIRGAIGPQAYDTIMNAAARVAHWAHETATLRVLREGGARGSRSSDNIIAVRNAYSVARERVPSLAQGAWQFYKDLIDSVYISPKRIFYNENHALLTRRFGGYIPESELTLLNHEMRTLGGDMTIKPGSETMRQIEASFPYLSQTKLGAYHLMRNMGSRDTYSYVLPRLAMLTYGVGQGMYFMTYWNKESSDYLWNRTPEFKRFKTIFVPSVQLLIAWARGENPSFRRDLFYEVPLPPDFVGIVAGTAAMMQMLNMIPASATPRPIAHDLPKTLLDSLMPAMPPLMQTALGAAGMRIDPQTADIRGGNWIRSMATQFQSGPQTESKSNLGEVSNTMALIMNGAFGAMGAQLANSVDVFLHASKFDPQGNLRQSYDLGKGLRAATNELVRGAVKLPDIPTAPPLLWQNKERYSVMTPAWSYVKENNTHLASIAGVHTDQGKAGQEKRELARRTGGIAARGMQDEVLLKLAEDIHKFQRPSGELGKLRKQYRDLTAQSRALNVAYNMPNDERDRRTNLTIKLQQDNMQQQHLAIKWAEQQIEAKYGRALAPMLEGRPVTIQGVDQLMREKFKNPGAGVVQ